VSHLDLQTRAFWLLAPEKGGSDGVKRCAALGLRKKSFLNDVGPPCFQCCSYVSRTSGDVVRVWGRLHDRVNLEVDQTRQKSLRRFRLGCISAVSGTGLDKGYVSGSEAEQEPRIRTNLKRVCASGVVLYSRPGCARCLKGPFRGGMEGPVPMCLLKPDSRKRQCEERP
jgi:hypothetical protein